MPMELPPQSRYRISISLGRFPCPPAPHTLGPRLPLICFLLLQRRFPILRISYEWNLYHMYFCICFFFPQYVFEIHLCHCMYKQFVPFYCCISFYGYNTIRLSTHLLMDIWVTSNLWHYEKSWYKHLYIHQDVDMFLWLLGGLASFY